MLSWTTTYRFLAKKSQIDLFTKFRTLYLQLCLKIVTSEGWRDAWQPSPQGNQEPLVVKDKVGRPQVSLGWASPWNVILWYFFLQCWCCWLGDKEGHPACKKRWVLICWWWRFDWSLARLIAPVVTTTSVVTAPIKSRMETLWSAAYPGCLVNSR